MSEITKHVGVVWIHCLCAELGLCLYQQSNIVCLSQPTEKEQESCPAHDFPPKVLLRNIPSSLCDIRRLIDTCFGTLRFLRRRFLALTLLSLRGSLATTLAFLRRGQNRGSGAIIAAGDTRGVLSDLFFQSLDTTFDGDFGAFLFGQAYQLSPVIIIVESNHGIPDPIHSDKRG